ncbi:MAG: hypothetical protein HY610_02325 [Elusimicrobia bacterium]|nr:hypothetical protein [Elusimicrobiota bacterium]
MKREFFLFFCLALVLSSCIKEEDEMLESGPPSQTESSVSPVASAAGSVKQEPPRYVYPFAHEKDPFRPLVGSGVSKGSADKDPQRIVLNFSLLELKGIIQDKNGKIALISSRDGEPFTLKSGRIYDKRNRKMNGVTGIIKENSIVIFGESNNVKELSLRK